MGNPRFRTLSERLESLKGVLLMNNRIEKIDLIKRVAQRTGHDQAIVTEIVDTTFEEIYEAFKREEKVSIRNFGTFYIDVRRSGTVFKFNPAQRLRALFGWSSTYKGQL
jgi:DNA-binding protein HU-beta